MARPRGHFALTKFISLGIARIAWRPAVLALVVGNHAQFSNQLIEIEPKAGRSQNLSNDPYGYLTISAASDGTVAAVQKGLRESESGRQGAGVLLKP